MNTQVDASSNSMGTAGAKAFGEMLQINTTLTQLNVSGNSFGKMQVGDSVKLKSNGEFRIVVGGSLLPRAEHRPSSSQEWWLLNSRAMGTAGHMGPAGCIGPAGYIGPADHTAW